MPLEPRPSASNCPIASTGTSPENLTPKSVASAHSTPVDFNTVLTGPSDTNGSVSLAAEEGLQFKYNSPLQDAAPWFAVMVLYINGAQVGSVDYIGTASGEFCSVTYQGLMYSTGNGIKLVFTDGDVHLSA